MKSPKISKKAQQHAFDRRGFYLHPAPDADADAETLLRFLKSRQLVVVKQSAEEQYQQFQIQNGGLVRLWFAENNHTFGGSKEGHSQLEREFQLGWNHYLIKHGHAETADIEAAEISIDKAVEEADVRKAAKDAQVNEQRVKEETKKTHSKEPFQGEPAEMAQISRVWAEQINKSKYRNPAIGACIGVASLPFIGIFFLMLGTTPWIFLLYVVGSMGGLLLLCSCLLLKFSEAFKPISFICTECEFALDLEGTSTCTHCHHTSSRTMNLFKSRLGIDRCPSCRKHPIGLACTRCQTDNILNSVEYDRAPEGAISPLGVLVDLGDANIETQRRESLIDFMIVRSTIVFAGAFFGIPLVMYVLHQIF